ncbi:nickel import ATP-binding protein NikE (plasmid) [Ochrobactrum quorumnocens]|uniref:Nickel import ATP-binding protein NikE n=1 Tax=Ochrobactrum quorumnocens TaxID=271865 RepID=A0A248UN88_9HYPH|nr:ABC transporter ATP-binding protein [[Ochrobactrum] quorumnocens]ASV88020.1 nickel import ATP-binding protein NikE [[Ochrobactrum] quorumnocens]
MDNSNKQPLLKISGLQISSDDGLVVDDVDLTLQKGRVLGLIGESGAGKSTIGLATLGFARGGLQITGGTITLDGQDVLSLSRKNTQKMRGCRISYVAQSAAAAFNPAHKLIDQVIEATVWHKLMKRSEAKSRAVELFTFLGLPDPQHFGERYPHQVSGGQLQRAMTAMALCASPDLVVFDEPTTALDVTTQIEVLIAIKKAIATTGTAALYISHDLAVVAQIADDIMVLRHGKMVEQGSVRKIFDAPREDYTRELVAVRQKEIESRVEASTSLLTITNISAAYNPATPVLTDITLDLAKGQTLAIVGESGSGKSTLARVVSGLLQPTAGEIRFDGTVLPASLERRSKETLRNIQMISQLPDLALNPRRTIADIISRPLQFYFGMPRDARRKAVAELIDLTELPKNLLERYPAELSGGQKQRVCIARALAARPKLLLCDEPTSALDPLVAESILELLRRVQSETKTSYLFITHDLAIVRTIADKIAVMHQGSVVRYGLKLDVLSPPYDDYTAKLLASVPQMKPGWLDDIILKREERTIADTNKDMKA